MTLEAHITDAQKCPVVVWLHPPLEFLLTFSEISFHLLHLAKQTSCFELRPYWNSPATPVNTLRHTFPPSYLYSFLSPSQISPLSLQILIITEDIEPANSEKKEVHILEPFE